MIDSEIDVGQDYIEPEVLAELAFDLDLSSFSGDQSVSSQSQEFKHNLDNFAFGLVCFLFAWWYTAATQTNVPDFR